MRKKPLFTAGVLYLSLLGPINLWAAQEDEAGRGGDGEKSFKAQISKRLEKFTHLLLSKDITFGPLEQMQGGGCSVIYKSTMNGLPVVLKGIDIEKTRENLETHLTAGDRGAHAIDDLILDMCEWEVMCFSAVSYPVRHPNVIPFYGIYETPESFFWVMGLADDSLERALFTHPSSSLSLATLWEWALGTAQGLAYLHGEGILHRDIKPANILIDGKQACLADLGVGQVDHYLTPRVAELVKRGIQSRSYKAPEAIVYWTKSSPKTDVYSLGLTFWQMIAGKEARLTPTWEWLRREVLKRWQSIEKRIPDHKERCRAILERQAETFLDPIPEECRDIFANHILPHLEGVEREATPDACPLAFKQLILECWAIDSTRRPTAREIVNRLLEMGVQGQVPGLPAEKALFLSFWHKANQLTHPMRPRLLSYIPVDVTDPRLGADGQSFWRQHEATQVRVPPENFPSIENVFREFLANPQVSTLFLVGDDDSGTTSAFYKLVDDLLAKATWDSKESFFPILVRPTLDQWSYRALTGALRNALRAHGGFPSSMRFLFLVDGLGECVKDQVLCNNLANQLGLNSFPESKMIVTCQPGLADMLVEQWEEGRKDKLWVSYLFPFTKEQMEQYLEKTHSVDSEAYQKLQRTLQEAGFVGGILHNPLMWSLFVRAWKSWNLEAIRNFARLTRRPLYHSVIQSWIDSGEPGDWRREYALKRRLTVNDFKAFAEEIAAEAFIKGQDFLKRDDVVTGRDSAWYSLEEDALRECEQGFVPDRSIFTLDDLRAFERRRLSQFLSSSPLHRIQSGEGAIYGFRSETFFAYFLTEAILACETIEQACAKLGKRPIQEQMNVLDFIKESYKDGDGRLTRLKEILWEIIQRSRTTDDEIISQAAANAATLLNAVGFSFSGQDLRGAKLKEAYLPYGVFDGALFHFADLRNICFYKAWIARAIFDNARTEGITLGERPALEALQLVSQVCYSPDGVWLAVTYTPRGSPHMVALFKNDTGERGLYFPFPEESCVCADQNIAFSHDGSGFAAASKCNDSIYFFEVGERRQVKPPVERLHQLVTSIASSQSTLFASAGNNTIRLWNKAGEAIGGGIEVVNVSSVTFSPDSQQLVSMGNNICLWRINPETKALTLESDKFVRPAMYSIRSVAFHPMKKQIAACLWHRTEGTVIQIWDMAGNAVQTLNLPREPEGEYNERRLSFSSGGRRLFLSSRERRHIEVRDTNAGHLLQEMPSSDPLAPFDFSPDGKEIAIGMGQTVHFQDLSQPLGMLPAESPSIAYSIAVSSTGQVASGHADHIARVWSQSGQLIHSLKGHTNVIYAVDFNKAGDTLATGSADQTIRLWTVETGECVREIIGHASAITALTFSRYGLEGLPQGCLFSNSYDGVAYAWNTAGEKLLDIPADKPSLRCVDYSLNGKWMASGHEDGSIIVRDTTNPTMRFDLTTGQPVRCIAFSAPDKNIVASGHTKGFLGLWQGERWYQLRFEQKHKEWATIESVAFSSTILASGGSDLCVHLWDIETGAPKGIVQRFLGSIHRLSFAPAVDSDVHLVTASRDKSIRYWRLNAHSLKETLLWTTCQPSLVAIDADFTKAPNLLPLDRKLLQQIGAQVLAG